MDDGSQTIRESVVDAGVLQWVLDDEARRNAIGPRSLRWISERAATLRGEIVLLTGAGDRAFCAGFDLTALGPDHARPAGELPDAALRAATGAMAAADATFVAALNGYAIGAGVELACSCDLRVARIGVHFSVPVGKIGVVYHADGLARMRAVFGMAQTQRLILLGERVTAEEAFAAGALTRVVPAEELPAAALDVVAKLRAAAPLGLRAHRNLLRALAGGPPPDPRSAHEDARAQAYASEDHEEGRRALDEGREPKFRGR